MVTTICYCNEHSTENQGLIAGWDYPIDEPEWRCTKDCEFFVEYDLDSKHGDIGWCKEYEKFVYENDGCSSI